MSIKCKNCFRNGVILIPDPNVPGEGINVTCPRCNGTKWLDKGDAKFDYRQTVIHPDLGDCVIRDFWPPDDPDMPEVGEFTKLRCDTTKPLYLIADRDYGGHLCYAEDLQAATGGE